MCINMAGQSDYGIHFKLAKYRNNLQLSHLVFWKIIKVSSRFLDCLIIELIIATNMAHFYYKERVH